MEIDSVIERSTDIVHISCAVLRLPMSPRGVFSVTSAAQLDLRMISTHLLGRLKIQPFSKLQQIGQAKRRAPRRRFQEGIGRHHIGQIGRKRALRSFRVEIEDPIGAPCLTTLKEFIARPAQRMKRVDYSEPATRILGISCS